MGSLPQPAKGRAKDVGGAFRALLQRTARRVEGGTRSPATLAMQREHVRYLLERIGRTTPVAKLTPSRIAQLLEQEGQGRRRPLSGGTLRKRASTLSQAIELARGRAPKLPEIPYEYRPRTAFLPNFDAYERLRDELPLERQLWLALAVFTGQRCSDVERMRREDFDPAVPYVIVRSTKTRRAGVRIHAAGELVRALREHWLLLEPGAKLVPAWPHANSTLRGICKRLELPHLSAQSMRHTFFTWYVAANGFTPELLAIGGWSSLAVPVRVYAHALPVRFRGQIERTFAVAKSLRRGPRKNLAHKAEAGTVSLRVGPKRNGPEAARTASGPVTSPRGRSSGTGLDRKSPPLEHQGSSISVGPAGFEPAAYGLKVRRDPVSVSVTEGNPVEGRPWTPLKTAAT